MNVPDLKRITYFNGQRLTAGDLTDAQSETREMRWLHNRSLHGWGIANGLQVAGKIVDNSVTVSPGYGIDCVGHEIILGSPVTLATPASFARGAEVMFYLVASWLDDQDQSVTETRAGACFGNGAVRLSDAPLLAWRSQQDLQQGLELILAQVWIQNCRISRTISGTARRYARLAQQPYIASGQAASTDLTWTLWKPGIQVLGWQADVDTSGAQFGATPQYFVQLEGEHYLAVQPGPLMAVGFAAAAAPRRNGFTFQVLLPQGPGIVNPAALRDPATALNIAKLLNWQVVWMGVED